MSKPQVCILCGGRGALAVTVAGPMGVMTYAHPCHGCCATGWIVVDDESDETPVAPSIADRLKPFMN